MKLHRAWSHRRRFVCATGAFLVFAVSATAQITAFGYGSASASVYGNGAWAVSIPGQNWTFSGSLGAAAQAPYINDGSDALGAFEEVAFTYAVGGSSRSAAIRIYAARPVILFNTTYNADSANVAPFPKIDSYPLLSHLSFQGEFSIPDFVNMAPDSPFVSYDGGFNTWILSAGANYMTASLTHGANNSLVSGITTQIGALPGGFSHRTVLAYGSGINNTFAQWGQAITDLGGKQRPSNSADVLLKKISYWTDNGATYYYNPGDVSYEATLRSIRDEFATKGVTLGSLQLDSWWYPKGPDNSWSSHSGIWTYRAAPDLFQPDLATFYSSIQTPLVTHARWIDAASPYRGQYAISNNVATDPKYWEDTAAYLKASGGAVYEQDWLGDAAQTDLNLVDPYAFLGNMAVSMAARGIDIQYCMATPKHFLQSSNYSNVTTIRVSQDRFISGQWTPFFYSSRFASAIGLWPYADVFMSGETGNMIASLLSAGPVGVGDPAGSLSKLNLGRAARADGVLVKPDLAATPIDSVFENDAAGIDVPMVASTVSDFGNGLAANYLFAYPRGANTVLTIDPANWGIKGPSYLYNYLKASGSYVAAGSTVTMNLPQGASYFVLMPVGPSGIAMVGDRGHFVTMGKQRIAAAADNGVVNLTVNFAPGELSRTLTGFSGSPVVVSSTAGSHKEPTWDASSQIFTVVAHPGANGTATVQIGPAGSSAPQTVCTVRCVR